MPDTPIIYNRNLDFLDTGSTNLRNINYTAPTSTGAFPVSVNPVLNPTTALDSIFANLKQGVAQRNPFLNNIGINQPIKTPLAQTARYDSKKYGFDPFNPNLEQQYGDRQSTFQTWKNYLLKFGANTVGAFVQTLTTIPEVVNAAVTGDFSQIYNNPTTNSIQDLLDNLEVDLPTYQTTAQKNNPVSSWIPFAPGSAHNWGMLLQNLGFTTGSIAGSLLVDAGIGLVTGGVGEAPLIAPQMMKAFGKLGKFYTAEKAGATTLLQSLKRTDDVFAAINTSANSLKILDKFRYGLAIGVSAFAEGAFEANQTFRNIKEKLNQQYIETHGYEPTGDEAQRIEEYARSGGNADLFGNVALLSLTNSAVFGTLFRPVNAAQKSVKSGIIGVDDIALKEGTLDVYEQAIKSKNKFSILTGFANKATRPVRVSLIEGFEEGSQFAMQRSAEDYYKRKFKDDSIDNVDNFFKSLGTGLKDTLTTREGLENVFMGILSGTLIHAGRGVVERKKGLNTNKNNLIESTLSILNNQRLSGLFRNTYDEAVTADDINKDITKALQTNDIFEYKNLKFQQLFNFIESGVRANRYDLRVDQLNMLKELKPQEFQTMFGINFSEENKKTVNEYVDNVINKAQDIKNNIDKVSRVFTNPYEKNSNEYLVFNEYKSQLALDLSEITDNKRRLAQVSAELSKLAPSTNIQDLMNLTNDKGVSEMVLTFQKRVDELSDNIENFLEDKQSDFYKDQVKERSYLQKKITDIREALEDFDEVEYKKHANDLINYFANGKTFKTDNNVSGIDVQDILTKAQDAFKLVNATDRALYHYQVLTEKKGFNENWANLVEEYNKQDIKFEESGILDDEGTPKDKTVNIIDSSNVEGVQDIDEKGEVIEKKEELKTETKAEKNIPTPQINIKGTVPEGFVDSSTPEGEMEFEKDPSIQKGIDKALNKQGEVVKNSIKYNANPTVLYNRIFTKDFEDGNKEKKNLREAIFSQSPSSFYNTIIISVSESTKGLKKGEYKLLPGFKELYFTGFDTDITLFSNDKAVGKVQPVERLAYKKAGKHIPLFEILPEDYERVTGNDSSTYNDFINQIKEYKTITDKITKEFKEGKTNYTNNEVKSFIDIIVKYGGIDFSKSEATSTTLKDLKYRGKGSAILSFPMIYNKDLKLFQRSTRPEILNKKELTETEIQDVVTFVSGNIDSIVSQNRRYIYLMKLPDGKFHKFSAITARPGKATNEQLEDIFKQLKTRYVELTKEKVKNINNILKEDIFIADSRNRKEMKSSLDFSIDHNGELYLDIYNKFLNVRKRITVTEAKESKNFEQFIDIVNKKLARVSSQIPILGTLNLKLDKKDFSKGILNDDTVTKEELENSLTVSVPAHVFDNFSVTIFPISGTPFKKEVIENPEPIKPDELLIKLSPDEQSLFNVIKTNINQVTGEFKVGLEVWLKEGGHEADILQTIISQYIDNWETGRKTFGEAISNELSKTIPQIAKAEKENIQTFQVATDKKSIAGVFKSLFGLKAGQANAVANIYDRTASAWANRTGKPKEDFYKQLAFSKSTFDEITASRIAGANIFPQGAEFQKELADVKKKHDGKSTAFKAPNGKISNLSAEQWYIVQTPTFKKWFGNSVVLDENGEPQVMYHGSAKTWDIFDPTKGSRNVGLFLTPEYEFAEDYGKNVNQVPEAQILSLFVKSNKPFDYENEGHLKIIEKEDKLLAGIIRRNNSDNINANENWSYIEKPFIQSIIKKNGFDGYYVKEQFIKNLAVYSPNQIKDATGENTTFLDENPSILFQKTNLSNSAMIANVVKGFGLEKTKGFGNLAFKTKNGKATPELANKINKWLTDNGYGNIIKFVYENTYGTVNPFVNEGNLLFQNPINEVDITPTLSSNDSMIEPIDEEDLESMSDAGYNLAWKYAQEAGRLKPSILNQSALGAIKLLNDGNAIIYALTNPNVSTPLHELAHYWEQYLTPSEVKEVLAWAGTKDWTTETSEKFAVGFEKYLAEGKAPTSELQKLFDSFKKWLKEVYKVIIGSAIDIELNDSMRKVYAAMLGENFETVIKEEVKLEQQAAASVEGQITNPIVTYADKLATMSEEDRDAIEYTENSRGYEYYMARKIMPKEVNTAKFKKVTEDDAPLFDYTHIANINGIPYGLSKDEDPDNPDDEKAFVWNYVRMDNPEDAGETLISNNQELVDYILLNFKQEIVQKNEENIEEEIIEPDIFTKNDEGSKVVYKGKELTVEEVEISAAGNTMILVTDGTKYGQKYVTPKDITKIHPIIQEVIEPIVPFDEGVLKNLEVKDYTDEEAISESEEDSDNLLIDYIGLKIVLENLKKRFNIPYKVIDSDEDWKGRFIDGVAVININKVTRDTPFHEYLHPFIAVMKVENPNLYNSIYEEFNNLLLENDDFAGEIINEVTKNSYYKNKTKEEQREEALVRFISKLAAKNINKEAKTFKSQLNRAYESIMSKLREWLTYMIQGFRYDPQAAEKLDKRKYLHKKGYIEDRSRANIVKLKDIPEQLNAQDLADLLSLHSVSFDLSEHTNLINKLNEFQADTEQQTEEGKIIARIRKRLLSLEDTAKRRTPSDVLLSEMIAVKAILKNEDEIESINNYIQQGLDGLDYANDEFTRLSTKLKQEEKLTKKDIIELNKNLGVVKNLLAFYDDVSTLFSRIVDELEPKDYKHYSKILNQANNNAKYIKTRSIDLLTEWLYPYMEEFNEKIKNKYPEYALTKQQFRNKLYTADQDSNFLFYWLGSVSSSDDPVSGITRTALFDMLEENHLFEAELGEDIKITYRHFLDRTGLKNEINQTEEYYKKNYLRKATTLQKTDEKDENNKFIYKYTQKWAFHEEYLYDLYVKEKDEFLIELAKDYEDGRPAEESPEYQNFVNKIFAWEEKNGSLSKPAERFKNIEFEKIYRKDELFTKLYETYKEANSKLAEEEGLKFGIVPQHSKGKGAFSDVKNKEGLFGKLKEIKGKVVNFILPAVEDETTSSDYEKNLDGSVYRQITVPYTRPLDEDDVSLVLPETIFKYAGVSNLTQLKREIEPNIVTLKSIITGNSKFIDEARKVNKVTSDRKTIFSRVLGLPIGKEEREGRLNKQLDSWIDGVMYGASEIQDEINLGKRKVDLNKVGGNLAFLTALNNMAFNITAGIGNVTIGNALSFGESLGGKYYTKGDWTKAQGQYFANTKNFMKDAFDLRKSKITQLGVKYDAIQGEFRDKYGKKFVGNVVQRYATSDTFFILNHAAEHQIQLTGMLALMNNTKVKTLKGEIISLYDAHIVNEKGFLRLRSDIEWTVEQEKDFTRKLHGINKVLNGNYSKFDKVQLQRTWYGKLLLIYRKFIYNAFRSRYGRKRPDYEIGDVMEGYYRKFFTKLVSDIKEYKFETIKRFFKKEGWSEDEKYAANKTLWELGLFMATMFVSIAIASSDDEDKDKSWGQNYLTLQMLRLRSDIGMYSVFGLTDVARIIQNPSAVILTLKRYGDVLTQVIKNPFETYDKKTGVFDKGDSILEAKVLKALPIIRQFINVLQPEEQKKFFKLLNKY